MIEILRELESVPSPSGFTHHLISHLEEKAKKAGLPGRRTNKGALFVSAHPQPELVIAGHIDTLGAMVKGINADGTLAITQIGGLLLPSFESGYITLFTTQGKSFRGTLLLNNPAAHVNNEAGKIERKPDNMHIRLDAEVSRKEDTEKLGIQIGDFICFDACFEYTNTGFVKAHFLDDKAGSSAMFDAMLTLGKETLAKRPVAFFFSNFEEVGHGACAGLPDSMKELLVVDMGVVGKGVAGDETSVSICVKDSSGPYDYDMRCRLADLAKKKKIPYKLDVFPFYGSDGSVALRAGYNIRVGLIGPGVSASHGKERTHLKGLEATRDLILAYIDSMKK